MIGAIDFIQKWRSVCSRYHHKVTGCAVCPLKGTCEENVNITDYSDPELLKLIEAVARNAERT